MNRLVILALALWLAAAGRDQFDSWIDNTVPPPLEIAQSVEVRDMHGDLLRAYTVADGRWRMQTALDEVDPAYIAMLLRYEDKRFYDHAGVDPVALMRGVGQALWHGRIVSGGSTLTMQVARLLEDGSTGTWGGKLRQIRLALALERQLDKSDILTLYLNRAPFGGNIEGVRAASLAWFGKPPIRLTPAQSALLVAIPQSPERRRPDRDAQAATAARDRVLARMLGAGLVDAETYAGATIRAVPDTRYAVPALAPHLADRVIAQNPDTVQHALTLDRTVQRALENLASDAVAGRSDRVQVAILALDHTSGEIVASVGSAAYRADGRAGFIDLTQAMRSPGSTLKPLVYGIGFDQGLIHPETLIADRPTDFGGYAPQNFDGLYRGELRVRTALQHSLNIPVVSVLEAMGPQHLIAGLRRAGAAPEVPGGRAGLAVALGGVGVTLEDLARSYAAIANGGLAVDVRWQSEPSGAFTPHRVLGDVAAWQIADILLEVPRPVGVQGTGIAYKTGTSYGHRDAWAIGFDGRHVVAVWMGRADGTPVPGAFGGDLAAPVMFAAFDRIKPQIDPIAAPPAATLLLPTAQLPQALQRFRPRGVSAEQGPRIAFPPDGAALEVDRLTAKVRDGQAPFTWLANGTPVLTSHAREVDLGVLGAGYSALTVIDAAGDTARVQVLLE
ncbi:penicillin-binding protein 1C [Yoonia sp. 208BN28-4]|uniref:penicillin-binding protein 1C n=1 Tax=Yoonia sp. 208BN28-4 TaxID=3126505 RepID=UPI0030B75B7C